MTIKDVKTNALKEYENNPRGCRIAIINDKYLLTSKGDIYRLVKHGKRVFELQAKRKHNNGYLRGVIDGKDVYIHRLVAMAFCDNPNGYKEVNHIDGNKENNCASNLEWCSRGQNNKHAFQSGLRSYNELSDMAKMPKLKRRIFTNEEVINIRKSKKTDTELAKEYSASRGSIYQIKHQKSYKEVV